MGNPRARRDVSQAIVLAGGLATRMLPRTASTPKYLLPVAGKPFADRHLELLAKSGIDDVVLAIGHMGDRIRAHVGDGAQFGIRVRYSEDGDVPRGTGGAIALAAEKGLLDDVFLVTYGDSYLPFDYIAPLALLRDRPDLLGVMAVFHNEHRFDASNVAIEGDRVVRYEKGLRDPALDHIDYGAIALRREALVGRGERFGLDELQRDLAEKRLLGALVASTRFYEIGSERGLLDLEAFLTWDGGAR